MGHLTLQRLFGVGPIGAGVTLILLAVAIRVDRALGHPEISRYGSLMQMLGVLLICTGLVLLFWSMHTLRNWWAKNRLCTTGPFRWFRHPMYAAWITFVSLGIALYLNSWVLLIWVVSLHPVWHWLVIREEKVMVEHFQAAYRGYSARTGRFIPRLWNPWHF
jgi:protein-S-isoprenylcysteine O-methyltransferase Ste14